jgi:glycosyltransferase involved in cell wall biosynthesis
MRFQCGSVKWQPKGESDEKNREYQHRIERGILMVFTSMIRGAGVAEITILVPLYNEAPCIARLVDRLDQFIDAAACDTSVLFVDDGSTDQSLALVKAACQQRRPYDYISLKHNAGLSAGLKAGLDHCRTPWAGYIDADLQTSPMDFLELLPHCGPFDLVTGIRVNRQDTLIRRISSMVANGVRRQILNDGMMDTCCPLKIGRTALLRSLPFFNGAHRFLPALVQMNGGRVHQVPVNHYPRIAGEAKFHLGNRLIGPLVGLLVVSWLQKHATRYRVEETFSG